MTCCCPCVPTGTLGVIQTCGKYQGLQEPGCSCICFPITQVQLVSLKVKQYMCKTITRTKDSVIVQVETAVQYRVNRDMIREAFFDIVDPLSQIEAEVNNVLRSSLPSMTLDASYEAKEYMVAEILTSVQNAMNKYGWEILKASFSLGLEESVAKAMNEINAQRRLREAAVEKGESEKFLKIKAAEAEAEAKRLAGVGMAAMRTAMAYGVPDSVQFISDSGLSETEAMQMMVTTQYLDTLKDFSNHISLVVPHRLQVMRSEASFMEAPEQMPAIDDEDEARDQETVETLQSASGKKGKIVRKKKRRLVKTGTAALCDCGEVNQV
eukprot:Skav215792  [mRNA]  locus=scaffold3885:25836:26923:+ [translate_table: standard]